MCGFAGRIGGGGIVELTRSVPWLRRRGPDAQREWCSNDGNVALMHTRLGIVDRDPRSDQPFADVSGGVAVALVGEVYNYREMKRDLSAHWFRTESDTEAVLAAYLLYGVAGLRRIKGMYAVAIVDQRRGRVFLARDPIGKKPLFIARWNGAILFGSSILALVAAYTDTDVEIEPNAVGHYWERGFVRPDMCVLRRAKPVAPGKVLEFDWSGHIVAEHDCCPEPILTYSGETEPEVRKNIGALLEDAVRRRLENNPTPTVLLSGGVDSTVVTKIAHTLCEGSGDKRLIALTLGAVIPGTNDEPYARYVARRLRIPLRVIRPHVADIGSAAVEAIDLQDEPLGMPAFFFLERLVRLAAQHGRVLLTGDGGDEVFLGYRPVADWRHETEGGVGGDDPLLPTWMSSWARDTVGPTLLGHMFAKADRASAEQGVELRCPLLDYDLVRYARSLPFEILAGGGRNKALLKAQIAEWPAWFVERRKLGFTYNLRWIWAMTRFKHLREHIEPRALETFGAYLPQVLRKEPRRWRTHEIFGTFGEAWRLLAWSRFLARLDRAQAMANATGIATSTTR